MSNSMNKSFLLNHLLFLSLHHPRLHTSHLTRLILTLLHITPHLVITRHLQTLLKLTPHHLTPLLRLTPHPRPHPAHPTVHHPSPTMDQSRPARTLSPTQLHLTLHQPTHNHLTHLHHHHHHHLVLVLPTFVPILKLLKDTTLLLFTQLQLLNHLPSPLLTKILTGALPWLRNIRL